MVVVSIKEQAEEEEVRVPLGQMHLAVRKAVMAEMEQHLLFLVLL